MPQNTPMKRQFTTIDGRTVMSNLPQHWGGNDWKITGVDNPLPVGNYVQTESGVWIPQKGSDDGAADVRLTGSNTEYVFLEFVELTAGSTVYTEAQNYNGSRLGVNVRFNDAIKHRVRGFLQSKQTSRGVGGSVTIIDSRDAPTMQAHGSLQMTTTRVNIGITNEDVIDTQINLVSIVDFMI